jgi:hypothetical protein
MSSNTTPAEEPESLMIKEPVEETKAKYSKKTPKSYMKKRFNEHDDKGKDGNIIRVASGKPCNYYVFLSKLFMKKQDTIEIHAFGNAISSAVLISENLVR